MTANFDWSEQSRDVDSFVYSHDKYAVIIKGELSEGDDRSLFWAVNLFAESGSHLVEISGHEESREVAEKRAIEWAMDHQEFAGLRLNDGAGCGIGSRQSRNSERPLEEREDAVSDLESWGFDEGSVFYSSRLQAVLRVTELNPDGFVAEPVDSATRRNQGVFSTTVWNAAQNVEQEAFYPLAEEVVDAPVAAVVRFAAQHVDELAEEATLDTYEGIEPVDTIADLKAAVSLAQKTT